MSTVHEADVVLLGGGGAAVIVLHHLAAALRDRPPALEPLRVVVVDPVNRLREHPADRTWCSWWGIADPQLALLQPSIAASWQQLSVIGPDGSARLLNLGDLRYVMVRSEDFYARVAERVAALDGILEVTHVAVTVDSVSTGADQVVVATPEGSITAQVALDSRPADPDREAATVLLQHFRGEVVREESDSRDAAVFMDFSPPQPPIGVAFGYRLPVSDGTTLVEYTEFSPAVLDDAGYTAALGSYRAGLGLAEAPTRHTEQGVIPMDDAVRSAIAGPRVVRIGGSGGATRGSTGYAFAAMQRQGRAMAAAIVAEHAAGRPLTAAAVAPPRAYPRRHVWMDAVMLRALASGRLRGADFFIRLFDNNPPARVLGFIDGSTSLTQEIAIMASLPKMVMLASAGRDAMWRIRSALGRVGRPGAQ